MRSNWVKSSTISIAFACLSACSTEWRSFPGCPPVVLPAVEVNLTNAQTGAPISGATLTLIDGEYSETLQESGSGAYLGAFGRSATYTLMIQAEGFTQATLEALEAASDECGVVTSAYPVQLDPV